MNNNLIEVAQIVTTQGVLGEVRAKPLCNSPADLCDIKRLYLDGNAIDVSYARVKGNVAIMKLSGVDSLEKAQSLKNRILYIEREFFNLGENEYFIVDLIGLNVIDVDTNEIYGTIIDVSQTGANDVYHIKGKDKTYLIPAIKQVVISTDIANNVMLIRPLDGLFE